MRTNSKDFNKESSFKYYKSSHLEQKQLSPLSNPVRGIFNKVISNQKENHNINILKTESNQNEKNYSINNRLDKILSGINSFRNTIPKDEKKTIKNSISSSNCITSNKKQETIINPLNRNSSNNKIYISRQNENKKYNQNISTSNLNNLNNIYDTYYNSNSKNKNDNKNYNTNKTTNIDNKYNNSSSYQSSYISRRNNTSDTGNKYQYRVHSVSKPQETRNESKSRYQFKTLNNSDNNNSELKQSMSQIHIKYNSNTSDSKLYKMPELRSSRKTPQPLKKTNITVSNSTYSRIQERVSTEPQQHYNNVYISNYSTYKGKDNKNKIESNPKIINAPSTNPNNYIQMQPKYTFTNMDTKNYKTENKPSFLSSYRLNTDNNNNLKKNYHAYSISQIENKEKTNDLNLNKTPELYKKTHAIISERHRTLNNNKSKDKLEKPQVNLNVSKNNYIYESKNINKEKNSDNNKYKTNYAINISNRGGHSINEIKAQKRDIKVESKKPEINIEKYFKISYNKEVDRNSGNKTPLNNKNYNKIEQTKTPIANNSNRNNTYLSYNRNINLDQKSNKTSINNNQINTTSNYNYQTYNINNNKEPKNNRNNNVVFTSNYSKYTTSNDEKNSKKSIPNENKYNRYINKTLDISNRTYNIPISNKTNNREQINHNIIDTKNNKKNSSYNTINNVSYTYGQRKDNSTVNNQND